MEYPPCPIEFKHTNPMKMLVANRHNATNMRIFL